MHTLLLLLCCCCFVVVVVNTHTLLLFVVVVCCCCCCYLIEALFLEYFRFDYSCGRSEDSCPQSYLKNEVYK